MGSFRSKMMQEVDVDFDSESTTMRDHVVMIWSLSIINIIAALRTIYNIENNKETLLHFHYQPPEILSVIKV